jgi:hypothetical protein
MQKGTSEQGPTVTRSAFYLKLPLKPIYVNSGYSVRWNHWQQTYQDW